MKRQLISSFAAVVALSFATTGFAAEKAEKKTADKPASEKTAETKSATTDASKPTGYRGKIASVDASAKTFTIKYKDGKEAIVSVSDKTQITKADGSAGTMADIKADEMVHGSRTSKGENKWDAVKVTLGDKKESDAPTAETK
jgi:hypothetical protein